MVVAFTAINGSKQEISPESGEIIFEGDLRPNGKLLCALFEDPSTLAHLPTHLLIFWQILRGMDASGQVCRAELGEPV